MSFLSREQIHQMIEYYGVETTNDISFALKDMFSKVIEEMLETELDTELGCKKNGKAPQQVGTVVMVRAKRRSEAVNLVNLN